MAATTVYAGFLLSEDGFSWVDPRDGGAAMAAAALAASWLAAWEAYRTMDCKMTDLKAAVGIGQLGRLPEVLARLRDTAALCIADLSRVPALRLMSDPPHRTTDFPSFWMAGAPSVGTTRDGLRELLAEAGISTKRGIMATTRQPACRWNDAGRALLQQTERLNDITLILPVHHELDSEGLARIISTIRVAAAGART